MNLLRGPRHRVIVPLVALVALSVGAAVGLAKSGPTQITTKLYYGDVHSVGLGGPCPPVVFSKNSSGWATIKNDKGSWTLVVHMRDAKPGDFRVDLIYPEANDCEQFGSSSATSRSMRMATATARFPLRCPASRASTSEPTATATPTSPRC